MLECQPLFYINYILQPIYMLIYYLFFHAILLCKFVIMVEYHFGWTAGTKWVLVLNVINQMIILWQLWWSTLCLQCHCSQWYGAAPSTFDDDIPSSFGKNIPLPGAFSWSGQYNNEGGKDGVISWRLRTKMKSYQKIAIDRSQIIPFVSFCIILFSVSLVLFLNWSLNLIVYSRFRRFYSGTSAILLDIL